MKSSYLLMVSAVLWVFWGLVHVFAGIMTMKGVLSGDIAAAVSGIADAVDPATLALDYPSAAGAILGQHGFNLFWIGITTTVAAVYVWRGSGVAIFLAALVGGLTDLGYFLFIDVGGFSHFLPGTLMTLICASAILLSGLAYFQQRKGVVKS